MAKTVSLVGTMKFTQIITQQYDSNGSLQSNLIALGQDGKVYRYSHNSKGWTAYTSDVVAEKYVSAKNEDKEPF